MKPLVTELLLLVIALNSAIGDIVEIEDGLIEGTTMQSRKGVSFHAFFKIPFAKPPVGELRFQAPVRNDNWEGTLNATAHGPTCVQFITIGSYGQSEDCLHLNIFTKSLASTNLKPVIVYIHGGVS
jgi:para-nitrobenzyl esterase